LKGLGDVPRLAGIHPIYLVRQLYDFQVGANTSTAAAQMKKVVEKLSEDDMIAIAAYAASLNP
jgi:cytochrome c553